MTRSSLFVGTFFAACGLLAAGCARERGDENRAAGIDVATLSSSVDEKSDIVATIDGRPIRAADITAEATAEHVSPKVALQNLLDSEVLFAEAARRHIDSAPDVQRAIETSAVRAYLQHEITPHLQPSLIPRRLVERAYEFNKARYSHPAIANVWHILVRAQKGDAEGLVRAQRLSADLARRAAGVHSADEFRQLAATLPPDITPVVENVQTPRHGVTEEPFAAAAFALTKPGQTSGPVQTSYGYHVIYLVDIAPGVNQTRDEVASQLREKLFPDFENTEFLRMMDDLAAQHRVEVHADRLAQNHDEEGN